jgi:hypothetical protein
MLPAALSDAETAAWAGVVDLASAFDELRAVSISVIFFLSVSIYLITSSRKQAVFALSANGTIFRNSSNLHKCGRGRS